MVEYEISKSLTSMINKALKIKIVISVLHSQTILIPKIEGRI